MALRGFLLVFSLAVLLRSVTAYDRPPPRDTLVVSQPQDSDPVSPQQVHISMVGRDRMRISWITEGKDPAVVKYGNATGVYDFSATGDTDSYSYISYKSGQIHNVDIGPLAPDTVYYYQCGSGSSPEYNFKTPPAQFPIKFTVVGDFGQTGWTKTTLEHIESWNYDMLLLPGDLSYADFVQTLWDSFGRLVEPLASRRPWMVTQGNHEVEKIPIIEKHPFKSYNARWRMPFEESGSTSNLYYSFDVAGVHVIMLGSYTDFDAGSAQYKWLQADLGKVDRQKTPWLVALLHAPWYNSNTAHQGEGESMRVAMEGILYKARVDLVFAGHVHAYERFDRVYDGHQDRCGPVYITIGDGGNREGLANKYVDSPPKWSIFREASFGHGRLEVVNGTHARWSWHRNDDDVSVIADMVWLNSLAADSGCH